MNCKREECSDSFKANEGALLNKLHSHISEVVLLTQASDFIYVLKQQMSFNLSFKHVEVGISTDITMGVSR